MGARPPAPISRTQGGVRIAVRLTPNAGRDRIDGVAETGAGLRLKVRVAAVPEKGKANTALVKLLAKAWRLPAGTISVVAGHKDRNKTILVAGNEDALAAMLENWLEMKSM